jgi:hypothetical protein
MWKVVAYFDFMSLHIQGIMRAAAENASEDE